MMNKAKAPQESRLVADNEFLARLLRLIAQANAPREPNPLHQDWLSMIDLGVNQ